MFNPHNVHTPLTPSPTWAGRHKKNQHKPFSSSNFNTRIGGGKFVMLHFIPSEYPFKVYKCYGNLSLKVNSISPKLRFIKCCNSHSTFQFRLVLGLELQLTSGFIICTIVSISSRTHRVSFHFYAPKVAPALHNNNAINSIIFYG